MREKNSWPYFQNAKNKIKHSLIKSPFIQNLFEAEISLKNLTNHPDAVGRGFVNPSQLNLLSREHFKLKMSPWSTSEALIIYNFTHSSIDHLVYKLLIDYGKRILTWIVASVKVSNQSLINRIFYQK